MVEKSGQDTPQVPGGRSPFQLCRCVDLAASVMANKKSHLPSNDTPRRAIALRSFAGYRLAYIVPDLVSGITLAAIARADGFEIFTHPERINFGVTADGAIHVVVA